LSQVDPKGATERMVLVDVTPLTLGIEIAGGLMSPVVARNSPIPCSQVAYYTTVENNQTEVKIRIFQGERSLTSECRLLGTFVLTGIPPCARGLPKVRVTFRLDADGILQVEAFEELNQLKQQVVIEADAGRLTDEEIKQIVQDANRHFGQDQERLKLIEARRKLGEEIEDLCRLVDDVEGDEMANSKLEAIGFLLQLKGRLRVIGKLEELEHLAKIVTEEATARVNRLFHRELPPTSAPTSSELGGIDEDEINQYLLNLEVIG
jgi:molecular chaperone DnaK (HSP70)